MPLYYYSFTAVNKKIIQPQQVTFQIVFDLQKCKNLFVLGLITFMYILRVPVFN